MPLQSLSSLSVLVMEGRTDSSTAEAAAAHKHYLDANEQAKKQYEGLLKRWQKMTLLKVCPRLNALREIIVL